MIALQATTRPRWRCRRPTALEGLLIVLAGCGLSALVASALVDLEAHHARCDLSGRLVIDGQPLDKATVRVAGHQELSATSDAMGSFALRSVPVGCVTLLVSHGDQRCGYPIRVPRQARWEIGDLPLYLWRPLSGDPDQGPVHPQRREVIQVK